MSENIEVLGARTHNLKNIDVQLPKNKLVVITGLSGSGKSSLAFDTIYAEGQRRYIESFAAYARQFLGDLQRPDVDKISGLSPVISIEQKTTNINPRSTVGTVTEIYDFMRLLFARTAVAHSYETGKEMQAMSEATILEQIKKRFKDQRIVLLAPLIRGRRGHYRELFEQLRKRGFLKVKVDGEIQDLVPDMQLDRYKIHDIELVIDRLKVEESFYQRLAQAVERGLELGEGFINVENHDTKEVNSFSKHLMEIETGISYDLPSPNTFSFNSPYGACPDCKGLGMVNQIDLEKVIPDDEKTIAAGGIDPLGEARKAESWKIAAAYARKNKIDLKTSIKALAQTDLNLMLYGNEEGKITYVFNDKRKPRRVLKTYEGIVNMVLRWFEESPSDFVHGWAEGYMELQTCPTCNGTKLKESSLYFKVAGKDIATYASMSLGALAIEFSDIEERLSKSAKQIAKDILKEIRDRLSFLLNVGLHYLTLNRQTKTLSGGESQRIRLATQIGSQLRGITYILDEPSIGLHQRDNAQLIKSLKHLRDIGNSIIVVEHDEDIMKASDYIVDMGPRAGVNGGYIVAEGAYEEILKQNTLTAAYLNHNSKIEIPEKRREGNGKAIVLKGAKGNNLKNVNASFPLGVFTCITGVSGSGKSTLINGTLYPVLSNHAFPSSKKKPLAYQSIEGLEHVDKVVEINQSPIGRTPRSNPATYTGIFNEIRTLFAAVPEAKIRGYKPGRFSFNVKGGRCETCQGGGMKVIEMNFLPDVYVPCEECSGKRYNRETLEIRYKQKSISDVLEMTIEEANVIFEAIPQIYRRTKTLCDVGLGYLTLGQNAVTLSGGEAQRVKLATELSKKATGSTIYILDEPSTGLHFEDIRLLLNVLNTLVDKGNTVLVIEHNIDIIKSADYIIDIGPEGGEEGGQVVAFGTPEKVARSKKSLTAPYLKEGLKR